MGIVGSKNKEHSSRSVPTHLKEHFRSTAIRTKECVDRENEYFHTIVCSMQGWRVHMEDAFSLDHSNQSSSLYFGVFDGHGSSHVSCFCAQEWVSLYSHDQETTQGNPLEVFPRTFFLLDEKLRNLGITVGGSTAICAILEGNQLAVANCGDSRGILLCSDGMVINLSQDHKPNVAEELKRIELAGGFVSKKNNRVNARLACSRSLGDFDYKKSDHLSASQQMVTCEPDVNVFHVQVGDIVFLACDGVFDVMSNKQVASFFSNKRLFSSKTLVELMDRCLSRGSLDNMTCIAVKIKALPHHDNV